MRMSLLSRSKLNRFCPRSISIENLDSESMITAYSTKAHKSTTVEDYYNNAKIDPIIAPVSTVTDIHGDELKATAVLRIGYHHLHCHRNRFLPRGNRSGMLFHCVSQTCVTYPVENLRDKLSKSDEYINVGDFTVGVTPLISDIWIQCLGRTSITFGHVVLLRDDLLALASKVFVRQDKGTGDLIPISDDERTEQFPASFEDIDLPAVSKITEPNPNEMEEVFQFRLGPQHCIHQYADPSALAEFALQGLSLKGHFQCSGQNSSFQHLQPANLDETISCRVHKVLPIIGLYRGDADCRLLMLAELGTV